MKSYFESLKTNYCNDYLTSTPKKAEVLSNANEAGTVVILPNSNNRAVVIENEEHIFLQSYDTSILDVDKVAGTINKLWFGYSVTTMKHINEFCRRWGLSFGKHSWEQFTSANIERG